MAGDLFGSAVALSSVGHRIVIGGQSNDATGASAGHARVFERRGDGWVQLGGDLDGEAADDRFGGSVAISAKGSRVAVGSYLNDGGGTNSGSVRVFDYTGAAWIQVGADIDGAANQGAGWAVDISSTGHRIVVGGPSISSITGHARVYELAAGAWTQVGATITETYEFAAAVSISGDGNRIAVGQPSANGSTREGTTLVYDWDGTVWAPLGGVITGEGLGDIFGTSLSLSNDGSTLAVGGPSNVGQGAVGGGASDGHVRVYRLVAGTWTQVGADIDGVHGDSFGTSVSLSGDGTRLVAGGPSGSAARYYTLVGDVWSLSAPTFVAEGRAGTSVAISADGRTAAVGAVYFRGTAGNASGVVRIYALP